ncbi:MAG: hypothetical protein RLY14_22 [Planctomycetota bacterium]|jgi:nucleotide-binding universal stress UspA family protein
MAWPLKKCVLVPFDFSDHSHYSLKMAMQIVGQPSQVHVLHVLPFLIPTEPGVVWATIDDAERIRHASDALRDELSGNEFKGIATEVRLGDPGQVIADRAVELGADLIVIPSHGRTGFSRFLLGSVAERVVRLASCPVLVTKLPTEKS